MKYRAMRSTIKVFVTCHPLFLISNRSEAVAKNPLLLFFCSVFAHLVAVFGQRRGYLCALV